MDSTHSGLPRINVGSRVIAVIAWEEAVCALAMSLTPNGRQNGLLGAVLSAENYALMPGPPDAFLLEARIPGAYPVDAAAPVREAFKANAKHCAANEEAMHKLTSAVNSSVDPTMLEALRQPHVGLLGVGLQAIMAHISATYAQLTPVAFKTMKAYLGQRMNKGVRIEHVLAEHSKVHSMSVRIHMPLSEHDRVSSLCAAVEGENIFTFAVNKFKADYPSIAQQTFAMLAATLLAVSQNEADEEAGAMGLTAMAAPGRAYAATEVNTGVAAAAVSKPGRTTSADKYCWLHGNCAHAGTDCDKREDTPGFKTAATKSNPMGGTIGNWADVKKKHK